MPELMRIWRQVLSSIAINMLPMLGFALVFRVLGIVIFAPMLAYGFSSLVQTSGDLAIANADIASFILSPAGIAFAMFSVVAILVAFFAEQGGFLMIIAASDVGKRLSLFAVIRGVLARMPQLMSIAALQTAIGLAFLLPIACVAGGLYFLLLGAHDINWYLSQRPPQFYLALGLGGALATIAFIIALVLMTRWAVAIPVCFFEDRWGRTALVCSRSLMRGHGRSVIVYLLGWIAVMGLVAICGAYVSDVIAHAVLGSLTSLNVLITATALIAGTTIIAALVLSLIGFSGYSVISYGLFKAYGAPGNFTFDNSPAKDTPRFGMISIAAGLAAIAIVSAILVHTLANDLSADRKIAITAHRGSSNKAPENTLSAIRMAIEDGADFAEIDVQETADGTIVLLHDSDLLRVSGDPAKIWNITDAELEKLEAGMWFAPEFKGEPIPTLKQAIALARGKIKLNIELKYNGHDQALAKRVVDLVLTEKFEGESFIASLEAKGLAEVRALAPQLKTGQIVTVAVGSPEALPVNVLSMNQSLVSARQLRLNRKAGRETHVWTVNDVQPMLEMIDLGVDNIITDEPALLGKVIAERQKLSSGELLLLALSRKITK